MLTSHRLFGIFTMSFFTAAGPLLADEGMWLLNQPPSEHLRKQYDFAPSAEWYEHLQKASIRISAGGSASFVSPDGLLMTNHHVGSEAIAQLSGAEHDYIRDGFLAPTRDRELACPEMELSVLMQIVPVSDRVNAAVTDAMPPAEARTARNRAIAAIEKEYVDKTGWQPETVTLYNGARYDLYLYKRYTDVRLVFAPEKAIASFGGDIDNFEYPRYCLDVCFFRAYEGGKPAKVEHYLKWSDAGSRDGDLVFITGHPGRTQRMHTMAHLEFLRDVYFPILLSCYNQREIALNLFSGLSDEHARRAQEDLGYIQNGRKFYNGLISGLLDESLMNRKREAERQLREFVSADPRRKEQYAAAWDDLHAALDRSREWYPAYMLMENHRVKLSQLYDIARKLLRAAQERAKPDGERLKEYRDAALPSLEVTLFSTAPIYDDLERATLEDGLVRLGRNLGGSHEIVRTALGGMDAGTRAATLISGTKLADVGLRKKLYEGGLAAVEASDDPMIQYARKLDPLARTLRERYERELESVEHAAYARIAQSAFDLHGQSVYPDATFTLRLSIGTVAGYEEGGASIPPFTDVGGVFALAESRKQQFPYQLPQSWITARERLKPGTPFNFVTTNDIIGGNSGSPMVDREGRVIGIVFDGNIHGLIWDVQFDQTRARAVGVDSRAIIEALRKVYNAGILADELLSAAK